jgi:hypothetical protein
VPSLPKVRRGIGSPCSPSILPLSSGAAVPGVAGGSSDGCPWPARRGLEKGKEGRSC